MSTSREEILDKLYQVLYIVPTKYINALLTLHEKLDGKGINWIVNGDLAETLRTVKITPECIEIVCTKKDTERIYREVQVFNPSPPAYQTIQLSRNALVDGKRLPVFVRSHYFDFNVDSVTVKVHGDLQFKVGSWDWGDTFLFAPEYVNLVGRKTAVTPLSVKAELYQYLGWSDRFEMVKQIIQKPILMKLRNRLKQENLVQNQPNH